MTKKLKFLPTRFDEEPFELYGGKISNNQADGDGGGVYVHMHFDSALYGVFRMFGGIISGNTAGQNGGGFTVFRVDFCRVVQFLAITRVKKVVVCTGITAFLMIGLL